MMDKVHACMARHFIQSSTRCVIMSMWCTGGVLFEEFGIEVSKERLAINAIVVFIH